MAHTGTNTTEQDLTDLVAALSTCRKLLPILSELMADQPGLGPQTGTIGRHAPESVEPWAAEAAHAYFLIYMQSRTLADELRAALGMRSHPWKNGETGLTQIEAFATISTPPMVRHARTRAEHWVKTALRIRDIDEAEVWKPVPREPDSEPPVCPYCDTLSLRLNRQRGEVRCFYPGCCDADGNPTRARMEFGRLTGEGMLVFGDGTTLTYRPADITE
jgi:hypothetical protein